MVFTIKGWFLLILQSYLIIYWNKVIFTKYLLTSEKGNVKIFHMVFRIMRQE
jgi:hypothetical protein